MTIRITGMNSGLDVESLVTTLMKAERIPVDKKIQQKTLLQYKMDQYREVNTKLVTLREKINSMRYSSNLSAVKASSSNENAVKVSGSNPAQVSSTIEVTALAKQAIKNGSGAVTGGQGLDITKSLEDNASNFATQPTLSSSMSIEINGKTIQYSKTDTIQQIMNKVNSSGAGVAMSYDSAADQFVFVSKGTGTDTKIEITGDSAGLLAAMKMDATVTTGTNAEVSINGVTSERQSNTFTQDGVTYTLLQTTSSAVTVTNSPNTDDIVSKVKDFVAVYNEAMTLVNQLTKESKAKGYNPLTDDEKSAMSETDIANWEKMVKRGVLRNDPTLTPFARTMRGFLSNEITINGTSMSAFSIGLETTAFEGNASQMSANAGKIVLDEAKLRAALESDPTAVNKLFTNTESGQEGLFQNMYKQLNTTISAVTKKSGAAGGSYSDASIELGRQFTRLETTIATLEDKLSDKEDRYYSQFAAMEKALSNSNSQLSSLLSALGS